MNMRATPFAPRTGLLLGLLLIVLAYAPVARNDFIAFDDGEYILDNPQVTAGLRAEGVRWALTSAHSFNWHPVTWMSHMLDCSLFGVNPAGHHLMGLLLHLLNAVLLYAVLALSTGRRWPSLWVAILWGVHPLQVESVAWASERKNVLSTLFWLLTMLAYVRYVHAGAPAGTPRPAPARSGVAWAWYGAALLCLTMGLMAKQMLVTLPCALLLWDYWPLRRGVLTDRRATFRCVLEKIPFLAVAVAGSVVAFLVQSSTGVVKTLDDFPLHGRLANAVIAYATYVVKLFWPSRLAIFYPHQGDADLVRVAGAGAFLVAMTILAILAARRSPHGVTGWLWFVGTLVPVIGLVQVGVQGMADRYMYVPSIGLLVALAWGVDAVAVRRAGVRRWVAAAGVGTVLAAAAACWSYVGTWRDSITLYTHAARVQSGNYWAEYNLGERLQLLGRHAEAAACYRAALQSWPAFPEAHYNLAVLCGAGGRSAEAEEHYRAALAAQPAYARAHVNLAGLLTESGRLAEALEHYREAVRLDPAVPEARVGLGTVLLETGKAAEALPHLRAALALRPGWPFAEELLQRALAPAGDD